MIHVMAPQTERKPVRVRRLAVDGLIALAVGLAYYAAARLGLHLALVRVNVTPLWPPTGIAVVAIMVYGRRAIPGIAVAALTVNATISPSMTAASAIAIGNTLAPIVAVGLLRAAGFRRQMDRLRDAISIVFLAGLAAMTISATIGSVTLVVSGAVTSQHFWSTWAVWWTGDALGVIIVAPLLLTFPMLLRRTSTTWARRAEAIFLALSIAALSIAGVRSGLPLRSFILPFVAWAAFRFRVRGAVLVVPFVSGIAIWAAIRDVGAFTGLSLLQQMFLLQGFNTVVALSAFTVASLVTEREDAQERLVSVLEELEERVRSRTEELVRSNARVSQSEQLLSEAQHVAHIGSWEWDIAANTVLWSEEMYRVFGVDPGSFAVDYDAFLARVHPEDRERVAGIVRDALADPGPFQFEHRIVRPDGGVAVLHGRGEVECDEHGVPMKMVGTGQDITERMRTEDLARQLRESDARRRQALELNDEIVQGLAVAKYALDCADNRTAFRAVERTLMAARLIVSKLLEDESNVAPGDLVSDRTRESPGDRRDIAS